MLIKDGDGSTTVGYYQEKLYKKLESKEDATVRSMEFLGVKVGRVKTVGFSSFQILEADGETSSILFSDMIDLE